MIDKVEVALSIDEVKAMLPEKAKAIGFGVLHEYNFKTILQEKGFPIDREITTFEICNPSIAQSVLSAHPELAAYLPCRVSVYAENGKSYLSTIPLETIAATFVQDSSIQEKMKSVANKLDTFMQSW